MKALFFSTNELDTKARERFAISEELQMEHAAIALASRVRHNLNADKTVLIVCGFGNNGADGYAVARLLHKEYKVKILAHEEPKSELAVLQAKRAQSVGVEFTKMPGNSDLIVDCIFGSGLSRALGAKTIGLLQKLNASSAYKIACDVPSGLYLDGNIDTVVFNAHETVTMGASKVCLYSDFAKPFAGKIYVANLGVDYENFIEGFMPDAYLLEEDDAKAPFRTNQNTHKGDYGFVCVYAGNKSGAAILAAKAATRFGAGLVGIINLETVPEIIIKLEEIPKNAVLVAGCGLGNVSDDIIKNLQNTSAAVMDADLFYDKRVCDLLDKNFVLTPHPKEFASLLALCGFGDIDVEDVVNNRFDLAQKFSSKYPNIVLILKGANTIIAKDGKVYFMPLGSAILAKGGSGDVLCGMIAALLAQGYGLLDAAITATIFHAKAANAFSGANYAMVPTDIIENLCIGKI